jgi:tol-pal system-associated acyl-CoA thioesterase
LLFDHSEISSRAATSIPFREGTTTLVQRIIAVSRSAGLHPPASGRRLGTGDRLPGVTPIKGCAVATSVDTDAIFRIHVRVYYEDTDAGSIVYYANYLKYFERCRTELLRTLGIDQLALARDRGLQFVVAELQTRYLRPARLDDQLVIDAAVVAMRRCSLQLLQRVWRGTEELTRASVSIVCVDIRRQTPCRLPQALAARLQARLTPGVAQDISANPTQDG